MRLCMSRAGGGGGGGGELAKVSFRRSVCDEYFFLKNAFFFGCFVVVLK